MVRRPTGDVKSKKRLHHFKLYDVVDPSSYLNRTCEMAAGLSGHTPDGQAGRIDTHGRRAEPPDKIAGQLHVKAIARRGCSTTFPSRAIHCARMIRARCR